VLRRLSLRLQVYGVDVLMTGESGSALSETAENRSSRAASVRAGFSRLKPLWILLLGLGLAGAVLTIAADFATLRSVKVLTASCGDLADPALRGSCVTHGHEEHSYALVLIGAAALVMLWGATFGRSRPAAAAVALLGAAVLVIALVTDVPDIHKTGVLGQRFEAAHAQAGPGLWMEITGGALLFVTGAVGTAARPRPRRRRRARAPA
jgi:hypothetical protein